MEPTILTVFAKAPIPGHVKTRLIPPLTPLSAASLHTAFVRDTLSLCAQIPHVVRELWTDYLTDAWPDLNVARKLQISGDLGLKMFHCLTQGLNSGAERVLIVGSDSPTLPMSHLESLLASDQDVVFGPADDGGYYAICARRIHPAMFDGVQWSTANALQQSVSAVTAAGLTTALGPAWYDIDDADSLERLRQDPCLRPATREWFQS